MTVCYVYIDGDKDEHVNCYYATPADDTNNNNYKPIDFIRAVPAIVLKKVAPST